MILIIFILASFAITNIVTQEYIFSWFRKLVPYKPFTCDRCFSVWVGFGLSFFFPVIYSVYLAPFIYSMISYTTNRIIHAWLNDKEININYDE